MDFQIPDLISVEGILRKMIVLTPEKHGVEKELAILTVDTDGTLKEVTASPKFMANVFDTEEDKAIAHVRTLLGTPVSFKAEKRIENKTGYKDDDGTVHLHKRDGYALRDSFHLSEGEKRDYETAGTVKRLGLSGEEKVQIMLSLLRQPVTV